MFKNYEVARQKEKSELYKSDFEQINLKASKSNFENVVSELIKVEELIKTNVGSVSYFEQINNGAVGRLSLIASSCKETVDYLKVYNNQKKVEYETEIESEEKSIETLIKRIEKKISLLKREKGNYSSLFEETFVNYKSLKKSYTTMSIDVESNIATLPIESSREISCNKIVIGEKSRGVIGKESGGNNLITDLLSDSENAFSFHKEDKCTLELKFEFRNNIVNCIEIEKSKFSKTGMFNIKNIKLFKSNGFIETIEIDEEVKEIKRFYFLPVEIESAAILIEQENSYIKDGVRIYEIDIKRVKFLAKKYKDRGVIESKENATKDFYRVSTSVIGKNLNFCTIKKKINDLDFLLEEDAKFKEAVNKFYYKVIFERNEYARRNVELKKNLTEISLFKSRSKILKCSEKEIEKRYVYQELEGRISCLNGVCVIPTYEKFELDNSNFSIYNEVEAIVLSELSSGASQNISNASINKAIIKSKNKYISLIEKKDEFLIEVDASKEIFSKEYYKIIDFNTAEESNIDFECKVINGKEYLSFPKNQVLLKYENIKANETNVKFGVVETSVSSDGLTFVKYIDGVKEFKETYLNEESMPTLEIGSNEIVYFELSGRPISSESINIFKEEDLIQKEVSAISIEELELIQRGSFDEFYYLPVQNQIAIVASNNKTTVENYRVVYEIGSIEKESLFSYNKEDGKFYFSENVKESLDLRNITFKRCDLLLKSTAGLLLDNIEIEEGYIDARRSCDNVTFDSILRDSKVVCVEFESDEEDYSDKLEYCTPIIEIIRNEVVWRLQSYYQKLLKI